MVPKSVVNDSAASKNSVVAIALSFSLSTGTSVKDLFRVLRKVPPSGYACADAIVCCGVGLEFGGREDKWWAGLTVRDGASGSRMWGRLVEGLAATVMARDWVCALDGAYPPFALTTELLVSKHC